MKQKSTYTRREIAMMYFPESTPKNAVRRLRIAIERCEPLNGELNKYVNSAYRKTLSRREVNLLFKYLGEPY